MFLVKLQKEQVKIINNNNSKVAKHLQILIHKRFGNLYLKNQMVVY
jgi:hypothetical protein